MILSSGIVNLTRIENTAEFRGWRMGDQAKRQEMRLALLVNDSVNITR